MVGLLQGATGTYSHKGPFDTQCGTCLSVVALSHKEAGIFLHQFLPLVVEGDSEGHLFPSTSGLPFAKTKHNPRARESP